MSNPVPPHFFRQVGVLAHRTSGSSSEVLLITSRRKGRWILPKGVVDPGETPSAAAIRETWEEAGVTGTLSPAPVAAYEYAKWGGTCTVEVFLLEVTDVTPTWPEADVRRRRWFDVGAAADVVRPAPLQAIVRSLPRLLDPNES